MIKCETQSSLASLKVRLEQLIILLPTDDMLGELGKVRLAMNIKMDKEEIYWEQRAKENWLQFGDRNSSFFIVLLPKGGSSMG